MAMVVVLISKIGRLQQQKLDVPPAGDEGDDAHMSGNTLQLVVVSEREALLSVVDRRYNADATLLVMTASSRSIMEPEQVKAEEMEPARDDGSRRTARS